MDRTRADRCYASTLCALTLAVLGTSARVSFAQSTQAESAEYGPVIDEALLEYRAGHFDEARELFWRAHGLAPSARTWRGIGMAEFELRNYAESVRALEQALASQARPLDGALRSATEQLVRRAFGFVARFTLRLDPSEAAVSVDGHAAQPDDQARLLLAPGEHVFEFRAPGRAPQQRSASLHGGEQETLHVALVSESPSAPAAPAAALAASEQPPVEAAPAHWYTNPWLWAGAGVIVAGAAVGVGFALSGGASSPGFYGGDTNTRLQGP
jgi:tetratricopeptide (TPR) repeat protein